MADWQGQTKARMESVTSYRSTSLLCGYILSAGGIETPSPFQLDRQIPHEFGMIDLRAHSSCIMGAFVLCKAKGFLYVSMGDVFAVHNTC